MLESILTTEQTELLKQERQWLTDLQMILARLGSSDEDQETLSRSIQQLEELFLLVVVGEFNAGKSAFINALVGRRLLKEGVTPTTSRINLLRYGESSHRQAHDVHLHYLTEPIDFLRQISIVDTPGTNAIIREHQTLTEEFVPRSDLVLFITSAERPFTESERSFLAQIKEWGKKVVMVINKTDIFDTPEEADQVANFVRENATILLGTTPDIFPVSARLALQAKHGKPEQWQRSGFEPLEQYIHDVLDETSRFQLKLLNPLGVGDRLLQKYDQITQNRLELLRDDFETLLNLERQIEQYSQDMERDFHFRMTDIENALYDMEKRGRAYFDEVMRLGRLFDLLNKEKIQQGFMEQVVANTPYVIEQRVNQMIDWLVNADLQQWQGVMNYLEKRRQEYEQHIVGNVGGTFRYDRDRLIESVGKTAQQVVQGYDTSDAARKLADDAQLAVIQTAGAEISAIGLGALVLALATTVAADVTGVVAASVGMILGLFVIPARKKAAQKELEERISGLRIQLTETLTAQFQKELRQGLERINQAVAPYTRFVRAEREKLQETQAELKKAKQMQGRLRSEIEALGSEEGL